MEFDELRQGLRRGVENAPLDDQMRVDLLMVFLKAVSELRKFSETLQQIECGHRPDWMDRMGSNNFKPLTTPEKETNNE